MKIMKKTKDQITIALSKGRILEETLPLFKRIGIEPIEDVNQSRKLIFESNHPSINFIVIRAVDVPTYVEYGVADLGIAGKDVIMESGCVEMTELLDLNIARCRLMTAKVENTVISTGHLTVATKYVNIARRYFATQGRQVDLIKLYGGMELAPIMGLADVIVDIVDTGNTLVANGLEADEFIANISSRLIASRLAMKMKHEHVLPIVDRLAQVIE